MRPTWTTIAAPCALSIVLAVCGACGLPDRGVRRPAPEQDRAAVRIDTMCGSSGSGVIVSRAQVLTALHVVLSCPMGRLAVTDADGTVRLAELEIATNRDVARLVLAEGEPDFPIGSIPRVKPARVGARVCISAAAPKRGRACGTVRKVAPNPTGGVEHSAPTVPGNSGSGLYDAYGSLVGIVVWRDLRREGGMATGLDARQWLVRQ